MRKNTVNPAPPGSARSSPQTRQRLPGRSSTLKGECEVCRAKRKLATRGRRYRRRCCRRHGLRHRGANTLVGSEVQAAGGSVQTSETRKAGWNRSTRPLKSLAFFLPKKKKIEWSQLKHNKLIYANRQCPKNSGPVIQPQCGQRVRSHGTHTAAWQKGTFLCSRGQWIWVGQTLDTHASPSMKVLVGEDEAGEFYCDASGDA